MSRRTWILVILAVLGICVLLPLCAVSGRVAYDAFSARSGVQRSDKVIGGDAPAGGQSRAGGTLRLVGGLPPTFDPALAQDSTSAEYIVHLFGGLVRLNSDLEVAPDLASRWEIGDDGRSYTFYLLPDATFADGRPIVAADFIYSLERACSPALGSPVAGAYLGDILGVSDYTAGRATRIAGLEIIDEHTLRIQIDAPKAYFLAKLTYPAALVVDRVQIEREGDAWVRSPNGSGPFVLESASQDGIVFARSDRKNGPHPSLERVEYIVDGGLPITMYENDGLDIVQVGPSDVERVLDPYNPLNAEHRVSPELGVQYLAFNVNEPPFDDPAVRRAFAHAIDKDKYAELVLKGTAVPARGILPPGLPDYDETYEGLVYDPERARQLLADSRYGSAGAMPDVVLSVSGTSGHMPSTTGALLSMIEDSLGIVVTVEQIAWADFLGDLNAQRYQAFSLGWIADYADSQNFLDLLFHSQSSQNHMGYSNPELDRILEQARVESDLAARTALYRQAERIVVDDAPWVPLTHGVTHTLVKPNVKGFASSASLYPWLLDIALEK